MPSIASTPARARRVPRRCHRAPSGRRPIALPNRSRSSATPPPRSAPAPPRPGPHRFASPRLRPVAERRIPDALAPREHPTSQPALPKRRSQLLAPFSRHMLPPRPIAPLPVMHQLRSYRSSHSPNLSARLSRHHEAPGTTLTAIPGVIALRVQFRDHQLDPDADDVARNARIPDLTRETTSAAGGSPRRR